MECRDFQCKDRRDRVYALLGLVKWPSSGMAIPVDYSLSEFEIALDFAPLLSFSGGLVLLQALGLTCEPSQVRKLIKERQVCGTVPSQLRRASKCSMYKPFDYHGGQIATVYGSCDGVLTAAIKPYARIQVTPLHQSRIERPPNDTVDKEQSRLTVKILGRDGEAAAYVSQGCRDGDILIEMTHPMSRLSYSEADVLLVVLRPIKGDAYRICGRGFMLPGYCFCRSDYRGCECTNVSGERHPRTTAVISLRLSPEDVVLFLANQVSSYREVELVNRLRLLHTQATVHLPWATATLTDMKTVH